MSGYGSKDDIAIIIPGEGKSVRLGSPDKWRHAIRQCDMSRSTLVDVEVSGLIVAREAAGDVLQLKSVFDEYDPLPAPVQQEEAIETFNKSVNAPPTATAAKAKKARAEAQPQTRPDPGLPHTGPEQAPALTPADAPAPAPVPAEAPAPIVTPVRQTKRPTPPSPAGPLKWSVIVLGGLFAIVMLVSLFSHKPSGGDQVWYVTRTTMVRPAPTPSGNSPVTHLERGQQVSGELVDGDDGPAHKWLKIGPGQANAGDYVWAANLSKDPRPALNDAVERRRETLSGGEARALPDPASPVVLQIAQGDVLDALGSTSDGWVEIGLAKGGVGYVQESLFQPPQSPANSDTAAAPSDAAAAPAVSSAAPAQEPAAAPASAPAATPSPTSSPVFVPPQASPLPAAAPEPSPARQVEPAHLWPIWTARPGAMEYAQYTPQAARAAGVTGRVMLDCVVTSSGGLSSCAVTNEVPTGYGFGQAALGLSGFFHVAPQSREGLAIQGHHVQPSLRFSASGRTN